MRRTTLATLLLVSLLLVFAPFIGSAQEAETQDNDDLLASIRAIFEESISELSAEIQGLRDEVQILRAEVEEARSSGGGAPPVTVPPPGSVQLSVPAVILELGATGSDVERVQALLARFGFGVPAGITGNFLFQTQTAIRSLQQTHGIPVTGIYDSATRDLFTRLIDFERVHTPPVPEQPDAPTTPETPPTITAELSLVTPYNNMLLGAGNVTPIKWNTTNAPEGARITFRLVNHLTGSDTLAFETTEPEGIYDWTIPTTMPGDNDLIAELFLDEGTVSQLLATRSATFAILGGTVPEEPSTPSTGTGSNEQYADFYLGSEFTTCMAAYPETIALFEAWIGDGLLRYQFPWSEITGPAADKVIECEGDNFPDDDYDTHVDCVTIADSLTCSEQVGCTWFDTFCGNDGYDPGVGGSSEGGSGTGTSEMYSCFYPNATVNGEYPGYTVWCEYDYQNCREGSSSGASVSLDGLALGAPSSCESGFDGNTSNTDQSAFVANVFTAFKKALQSLFGF